METRQLSIYTNANFHGGEFPIEIEHYMGTEEYNYMFLSVPETIALRDFLNSLDLDDKKDCKDGQHSGDTGKCSECGRTYIHGK